MMNFFGDDDAEADAEAKQEGAQDAEEELKLEVTDSHVLNQILEAAIDAGDLYQALFVLRDHRDLIDAKDELQIGLLLRVAGQLVRDQIQEVGHDPALLNSAGSFEKQIEVLLDFMLGVEAGHMAKTSLAVEVGGALSRDQQLIALRSRLRRALSAEALLVLEELHSVSKAEPGPVPAVASSS